LDKDTYSINSLKKKAGGFVENKVIEINSVNHNTFISDNPGKSKVLLFTDNKGVPTIFKALSYNFDKTLFFGIVRKDETALAKKYKVTKFPALFLIKPGEKALPFDGEVNYYNIANFINIYSEIFDFGDNAEKPIESAAAKPWMSDKLPELTKDSANDI